jgi:hypothetical protein
MTRGQFVLRLSLICSVACVAATVYALRTFTSLDGLSVAVITGAVIVIFFAAFAFIATKIGF